MAHKQLEDITNRREEILRLAERHGCLSLRVFGSRARGEAEPDSDLDLLAVFDPERSLIDHIALAQEIEDLLGVRVDLISERALHPILRDKVLAEAVLL